MGVDGAWGGGDDGGGGGGESARVMMGGVTWCGRVCGRAVDRWAALPVLRLCGRSRDSRPVLQAVGGVAV